MDLSKLKEPFPQSQVSWRAQTVTKDGTKALALAYIDARDVMERLDTVCGVENWQCRYPHANGKTVCEIGIKIDGEWVWKADGAGDSDIEAEKGALSDAFKRSAVRWGIGRYLYETETPWVPCESREFNGKKQFVKFTDDPWKHVRNRPAAPAKEAPKDEGGHQNRADAWIAKAKDHIRKLANKPAIREWQETDRYKEATAALKRDYPAKLQAFNDWLGEYLEDLSNRQEAA
jgi:hypothetical protein